MDKAGQYHDSQLRRSPPQRPSHCHPSHATAVTGAQGECLTSPLLKIPRLEIPVLHGDP